MTRAASPSNDGADVIDPVRWLNDVEMRVWRGFLEASGRVDAHVTGGLKAAGDLTLDDYEVLVHLSEAPGRRLRMSELSQRLLNSQSRLTQRIDRLAKRGLVCRENCPTDRRGKLACLTDDGFELLDSIAPNHLNDVRSALIDCIEPGELEVLAAVFERIAAKLRTPDGD